VVQILSSVAATTKLSQLIAGKSVVNREVTLKTPLVH
jgi:hypothetical protein